MDAAIKHYVDHIGLHEVSREADGRVYLRAWDEFDRHSVILRQADMPGMDYVGFKVASDADLDSFHHRIEEFGTKIEEVSGRAAWCRAAAELCRADRSPDRIVFRDGAVR
jgi:catechol 2,3-dioxygenase